MTKYISPGNSPRVLICDDLQSNYNKLKKYLFKEGYTCDERVENEEELRIALRKANKTKNWYEFIMIDIDLSLSKSGEDSTGIQLYNSILNDFPEETYIIYTSKDVERVRKQINRLMYRHVPIVLLDEVLNQKRIGLHLSRYLQMSIPRDRIFIVHGRDDEKNQKLIKLLKVGFNLEIVTWEDARQNIRNPRGYTFEIVLSGIEISHLTIVLFTDDEDVKLKNSLLKPDDYESISKGEMRKQSRPNVYIEAGYAMGKRPNRTLFIEWVEDKEHFYSPSDFDGIHVIKYSDDVKSREILKNRLEKARCLFKPKKNWKNMSL